MYKTKRKVTDAHLCLFPCATLWYGYAFLLICLNKKKKQSFRPDFFFYTDDNDTQVYVGSNGTVNLSLR